MKLFALLALCGMFILAVSFSSVLLIFNIESRVEAKHHDEDMDDEEVQVIEQVTMDSSLTSATFQISESVSAATM